MIVLDYRDKRPLYEQVSEKLTHLIVCGALEPGSRLPSVRNLAMDLSVNPNTIQRAYAMLEQDGYIYTVTGRGNYISEESRWKKGHLSSLEKELSAALESARKGGLSKQDAITLIDRVWAEGECE